jgi:hypothetical protein
MADHLLTNTRIRHVWLSRVGYSPQGGVAVHLYADCHANRAHFKSHTVTNVYASHPNVPRPYSVTVEGDDYKHRLCLTCGRLYKLGKGLPLTREPKPLDLKVTGRTP